ncbi:MAG: hypothetical protein CSA36_02035 [Draconibacterium sp.]|nr:MAG: hypothetical protein CSA36_02035 [Draconibacterium sp.]
MIFGLLLVLFYFLVPFLIIYLCKILPFLSKIGAVALAYIVGLIAGNTGLIPSPGPEFRQFLLTSPSLSKDVIDQLVATGQLQQSDYFVNQALSIQDIVITIAIPLAIPLLLFSLDLRKWLKLAKGALLSLFLAFISLIISVLAGYYLFSQHIYEAPKVAGMLVGVYTGGTPNLAAIGTALNINPNTFLLTHTYDLIIGSVILLFLLTLAQRMFHLFLPRFSALHQPEISVEAVSENENMENFDGLFDRKNLPDMLKALLIAIGIFAIGGGISLLVPQPNNSVAAILIITSLGLLASLLKPVNRLKNSFSLGMYFIIVFSLVIASMANLSNIFKNGDSAEYLFYFILMVVVASMVIHVGLSKIFKVDADTTIIAITALTYSPPFVPTVASAIKNKHLIISGLAIGIIGYAFGSYLGIFIGKILSL